METDRCKYCGADLHHLPEGCWWAGPDYCSNCRDGQVLRDDDLWWAIEEGLEDEEDQYANYPA